MTFFSYYFRHCFLIFSIIRNKSDFLNQPENLVHFLLEKKTGINIYFFYYSMESLFQKSYEHSLHEHITLNHNIPKRSIKMSDNITVQRLRWYSGSTTVVTCTIIIRRNLLEKFGNLLKVTNKVKNMPIQEKITHKMASKKPKCFPLPLTWFLRIG